MDLISSNRWPVPALPEVLAGPPEGTTPGRTHRHLHSGAFPGNPAQTASRGLRCRQSPTPGPAHGGLRPGELGPRCVNPPPLLSGALRAAASQDLPAESSGPPLLAQVSPLTPSHSLGRDLSSGNDAVESRVPCPSQVVCRGLFGELPRALWNPKETPSLSAPRGPPGAGHQDKAVWARCCSALHTDRELTSS